VKESASEEPLAEEELMGLEQLSREKGAEGDQPLRENSYVAISIGG
jgi:hypothetical protein